jgi:DNA-directed RNA polymerase specialized sigma24 family protein
MKGIIKFDFKANRNRNVVLKLIRHELYPETEFPETLFPDLVPVLFNCFLETIRSQEEFLEVYRQTADNTRIEQLAQEILVFKNLLENHPQTVVMMYRNYIKKFIKYKHGNTDEWEDLFQEVITRLISSKIYRIREKFDFSYHYQDFSKKSFFTSYLMVTVRNIYMDIIREQRVRPLTGREIQPMDETIDIVKDEQMLSRLVIGEEFLKFRTVLALYYKSRSRLELCLKLKCRIPITGDEIPRCFPSCSTADLRVLAQDFRSVKDKTLFDTVVPVFNRIEGTDNQSDTLRKWVSIKMEEIVAHMNHTHGYTVYNSRNLMDFVSLYYERFDINDSGAPGNPGQPIRR